MGAYRIKIAQGNHLHWGHLHQIAQHGLANHFGATIWRFGLLHGAFLGHRQLLGIAIHGATGGEYKMRNLKILHALHQIDLSEEVVVKKAERVF